jgi:hypothetical protein
MNTRMTGVSKLSSKLLTACVLSTLAWSTVTVAQSAATGPNKVYIEQVGNTNTITIEQVGGTNSIGGTANATPSSTNYATITGSSNVLAMVQTGDNNLGQYNIKGSNNTYTSTVTGTGNKTKLNAGDQNTNTLRSVITETISGDDNTVIQTVVGSDITSTLAITGNTNEVTKVLKSTNGISDISITGGNNKLDIEQVDASGANGHNLKQFIAGDYNSIVTQQQGTNDTTVDIKTTGSHNTITVRTSSSAIVTPGTAVAR